MGRRDEHIKALRSVPRRSWPAYLREHSGLPGPRANLELAFAVTDLADEKTVRGLLATNDEFLVLCGVIGLGQLTARGTMTRASGGAGLKPYAMDARWRVREGVALAVQCIGDIDRVGAHIITTDWADDPHPLVRRAAIAGICEPRQMRTPADASHALELCDQVTRSLSTVPASQRRDKDVRTLRQALGYCWSVAVAADPVAGLPRFLALEASEDPDLIWVARENRKKARLARLLP